MLVALLKIRPVQEIFWKDHDIIDVMLRVAETATTQLVKDMEKMSHSTLKNVLTLMQVTTNRREIQVEISNDNRAKMASIVSHASQRFGADIRDLCLFILKDLTSNVSDPSTAAVLATSSLELLVDPNSSIRECALWDVLGKVGSEALTTLSLPSKGDADDFYLASFTLSDFQDVLGLLSNPESTVEEWVSFCMSWSDRTEDNFSRRRSTPQILLHAVRQSAKWCVQNRLRTHFGGAAQTFSSVEQLLLMYIAPTIENKQGLQQPPETHEYPRAPWLLSSPDSWWGIGKWLTLEFVSSLELFIDHVIASNGAEHDSESEAYKTRLFFRANRTVCDDWLNRIRPLLAGMSSISSSKELSRLHHYAIVSVCYSKLRRVLQASFSARNQYPKANSDLVTTECELDSALFNLCRCCSDLKDVDSIIGLHKWASRLSIELDRCQPCNSDEIADEAKTARFGWLTAMQMEASMQYEDAIETFKELLRPVLHFEHLGSGSDQLQTIDFFETPFQSIRMSITTLLGCVQQCIFCHIQLQKWPQAREIIERFLQAATIALQHGIDTAGTQSMAECVDVWKQELELILALEPTEGQDNFPSAQIRHLSLLSHELIACQRWGLLGVSERLSAAELLSPTFPDVSDFIVSQFRQVALQPELITGLIVGKKLEQLVLNTSRIAELKRARENDNNIISGHGSVHLDGISVLDPTRHDSASWASHAKRCEELSCASDKWMLNWTNLARLARKQRNFELASGLLQRAESMANLSSTSGEISLRISYERAKLLTAMGADADGFLVLSRKCGPALSLLGKEHSTTMKNALVQALGRLAASISSAATTSFDELPSMLELIQSVLEFQSDADTVRVPDSEADLSITAAEKCLRIATSIMPRSPGAWFRYSNWCYELGKREVEQVMGQNGYIHLSSIEEMEMTTILSELGVAGPSRDAIVREFCLIFENGTIVPHGEKLRRICTELAGANEFAINKLVKLQASCRARILRYHLLAADSYGMYLQVQEDDAKDPRDADGKKQRVMLVALRVLHLLTKYGSEKDIVASVEQTFQAGPVAPWAEVVPQLIARADHPNVSVSSLVCLMLERLAHSYPHLLVYPAVVDSSGISVSVMDPEATPPPRLKGVITALRNVSSNLVDGVSLLVSELRRISILWDEAWIAVLLKLSTDVARRTTTLEKESARVARNTSLSSNEKLELAERKFVAIMKPVLLSLERVWTTTCGSAGRHGPLTSHEQRFLREYGALLERALAGLRDSCTIGKMTSPDSFSPQRVQVIWEPLDSMLKSLLSSSGRRDRLSLNEISPALLTIADLFERINMPGVGRQSTTILDSSADPTRMIHIQKLLPSVSVLKTKTKPKLLQFIGSDGIKHRYLLKAKEDLRLDERIMQFLTAVNSFLKADKASSVRGLSAKHYSVIPISNDAGLIQMVPDVLPFFQIYTANQEPNSSGRNPQMSPQPSGRGATSNTTANAPQPPTVQFYAMLKQHGIVDASQRSKWPLSVLRQIYTDLVRQLPRNMLKQELSLRSQDLRESWTKSQTLIKSLAVMSVLGYIVGLGDRHLDNILLCVNSGDVVHIDYNVCFDKGRRLKVPEVVPFRLTPMLQDALGLTGTDGPFRIAFETTLRVVRAENSREALLTLLEAFVYSPLTEWISEDSRLAGKTVDLKTRLEVNVNLSLFLSRAEERRQDTVTFGNDFGSCIRDLIVVCEDGKTQLQPLRGIQSELCALSTNKTALDTDISRLEHQMIDLSATLSSNASAVLEAQLLKESLMTKLSSFSQECLNRHEQIQAWREKAGAFHSSALSRYQSCIAGASTVSFRSAYQMILEALDARGTLDHAFRILPLGLEESCTGADMAVSRFSVSLQELSVSLLPSLITYSQSRFNLDAWLADETGCEGVDVYETWWLQASKLLEDLHNGANPSFNITVTRSTNRNSYSGDIASIAAMMGHLEISKESFGLNSSEYGRTVLNGLPEHPEESAAYTLEEIAGVIGSMRVSNSQSQKLLKLVGASSIIGSLHTYDESEIGCGNIGLSLNTLVDLPIVRHLIQDANAAIMLVDLVSTPKGALRRLRASDLLNSSTSLVEDLKSRGGGATAGFTEVIQLLAECESFALVMQEKLMYMNLSGNKSTLTVSQLEMIASIESAAFDGQSSLYYLHTCECSEWSDLDAIICQAARVVQCWTDWCDTLRTLSVDTGESATDGYAPAKMWLEFITKILKSAANQPSTPNSEVATFIGEFLNSHVKCAFRGLLSSIITQEWKIQFDVTPARPGEVSLREQWTSYMSKHSRECLPLSSAADGTGTNSSEPVVQQLANLVSNLTKDACAIWTKNWVTSERERRTARLNSIQKRHVGRLQYAMWHSQEPSSATIGGNQRSTRLELLSALSAHIPQLNAISSELHPVEVSVLELAQQMEYIISQLSNMSALSDNNGVEYGNAHDQMDGAVALHGRIQDCYSKASTLLGFARELCDLVQGISVLETSLRDSLASSGGPIELSVDTVGNNLVESLRVATCSWQDAQLLLSADKDATMKVAQELSGKRAEREQIAQNEIMCQDALLRECSSKKEAIISMAAAAYEGGERLVRLLSAFEKPRSTSKHQASSNSRDISHLSASAASASLSSASSQSTDIGLGAGNEARYATPIANNGRGSYSILENERLAKILLRSIRSIVPMDDLEDALEKHGQCFAALRGVVGRLELTTRDFLRKIAPVLPTDQRTRSSFLEITAGMSAPVSGTTPIEWEAELVSIANTLLEFVDTLSESRSATRVDGATSADEAVSLLDAGVQLLSQSLKLFFEVSDMADRLSSAQQVSQSETQPITVGSDANDERSMERAPSASGGSTSADSMLDGQAEDLVTQARSLRGMQVLSQIDDKLSGICAEAEPRGARVLTVEQQASWLIEEATKVDNLCVMYEGWTPWI